MAHDNRGTGNATVAYVRKDAHRERSGEDGY